MNTTLRTSLAGLALTAATAVDAEGLGRLFFTPEQRAQLEYSRQQDDHASDNPRSLTVNGIVQKHGGERTAWINGVPQAVGRSDEKTPESVPVPLPGQNKSVKLKVGQRVLLSPSAGPNTTEPKSSKPDTARQDAAEED